MLDVSGFIAELTTVRRRCKAGGKIRVISEMEGSVTLPK